MKHRSLIVIILVLSLLMIPVEAKASTIAVDRTVNTQESGSSRRPFHADLTDIINALPDGHHDNFAGSQSPFFCRAEGWAADPDDRTTPLQIRVFSDGVEVAQTVADTFRPDLADAGVCMGGYCSFSLSLWGLITPDVNHLISVEAQDAQTGEWGSLYDTPKTLNCFTPQAGTFLVNSTADDMDANAGDGVCETFNPGQCTLRAAIEESNATSGTDSIRFNIPGAGPYTISPTYGFDFINDPVIIDGTTQPGFAGTPIIELDGSSAGAETGGLTVTAGSSIVRGLVINRFDGYGMRLDTNGSDIVQGNYVGVDVTGSLSLGNSGDGIVVGGGGNSSVIGGKTVGAGNLISGNGGNGISLFDGVTGTVVEGNFIGTDASANLGLGNSGNGVVIAGSTPGNTVGTGNVISGNAGFGVLIVDTGSSGNLVQGNSIGTNSVGDASVANFQGGVGIFGGASDNTVGGMAPDARNVISGNSTMGVIIADPGTEGNVVEGNYIGTDVTGTLSLGNADDGVLLLAANNTVGGTSPAARNIISGNQEQGIRIAGTDATGNTVQGNFIGTDVTGSVALSNGTDCCHSGVVIHAGASHNTIGGSAAGAGNVISGNTADGVTIFETGTTQNVVSGNFIGTDVTGTQDLGNAVDGIVIFGGATDNLLGGTQPGSRNIIAGNDGNGIAIYEVGSTGNVAQGNFIGTDVTGTASLGNAGNGVTIAGGSANNTIGGTTAAARNVIAGNSSGIVIIDPGSTGNVVQGNYIGTDVSGTVSLANQSNGVGIYSGAAQNVIGGTAPGTRNLISGNIGSGVTICCAGATANVVQGNYIGTDATGAPVLGNSGDGVNIDTAIENVIGGTAAGAGNVISGNGWNGVSVIDAGSTGNAILSNSIYSNAGLGIDLAGDGVTLNDLFDADSGPNNVQNFPILNPVKNTAKGILIQGALLSTRNTTFRLEFFSNNSCDPSGYGEGQIYLGSVNVKTNSTGHVNFKVTLPVVLPAGKYVTATSTDPSNNTSEFSQCVVVSP